MAKIQAKKLSKRTNNKQAFKAFVDSDYTDIEAFKKACKNDENLLIYTCLKSNELVPFIEDIREIEDINDKLKYLKDKQPAMNETEERYEVCITSIASYLKNYITFNGFIMNNSNGDAEDWTSEFWLKYTKICNFYRDRWFHTERLKKKSTVVYNPVLYKEFVYICRMSITGERRHQAFLATQRPDSSIFKPSLDFKLDSKSDENKSLLDVVKDTKNDVDIVIDNTHINMIQQKALELSMQYEDGAYTDMIREFYLQQDSAKIDKKAVILGKIFLYKAGLVSPKALAFIKSLSTAYKVKFNISNALVNKQLNELKKKKAYKQVTYADVLEDAGKTRIGLLLRKRGTAE